MVPKIRVERNMKEVKSIKITTIVDNDVWKEWLASSWSLSVHVEIIKENKMHAILMDTGGSFEAFYKNTSRLGIDLTAVEGILISHWHGDHCGALSQVLPLIRHSVLVYAPSASTSGMRER